MTAIWSGTRTWSAGELITASIMNQYIRDNMDWLKVPIAVRVGGTAVTTTSTSLTDLTGATGTMTTNGGGVDVYFTGINYVSTNAVYTLAVTVDGSATTVQTTTGLTANMYYNTSIFYHVPALSAGSHTIKMQVSISSGTLNVVGYGFYIVERGG